MRQKMIEKNEVNENNKHKFLKTDTVDTMHINGIAGTIFALCLIAGILGAVIMEESRTADSIIGVYVSSMTILGTLFLFSLKMSR